MKYALSILVSAIISVSVTLLLVRHQKSSNGATSVIPKTLPNGPKFSQRWLSLQKESAKLDADFSTVIKTEDAKTAAEAAVSLKAYEKYCDAQANLLSRQEALYREEHGSENDPVLIEQRDATIAWCKASEALLSYMADPRNGFHIAGDETFANDGLTYNRLFLAFRVASVRLVNANGAEADVNKLESQNP